MPAIIVDPDLLAAVTRQFQLRGELQPFNLTENVVPTFDIGRLIGLAVQPVVTPGLTTSVLIGLQAAGFALTTREPFLEPADVFDDRSVSPNAGDVLADTGGVSASVRSFKIQLMQNTGSAFEFALQWRNAANSATLATFQFIATLNSPFIFDFVADMSAGERIRMVSVNTIISIVTSFITTSEAQSQIAS